MKYFGQKSRNLPQNNNRSYEKVNGNDGLMDGSSIKSEKLWRKRIDSSSCVWPQLRPAARRRTETSLSTVPQATNATSSTQETLQPASQTEASASGRGPTLVPIHSSCLLPLWVSGKRQDFSSFLFQMLAVWDTNTLRTTKTIWVKRGFENMRRKAAFVKRCSVFSTGSSSSNAVGFEKHHHKHLGWKFFFFFLLTTKPFSAVRSWIGAQSSDLSGLIWSGLNPDRFFKDTSVPWSAGLFGQRNRKSV